MDEQSPEIHLTALNRKVLERTLGVLVYDVHGGITMDGLRNFQPQPPTLIPKHTDVREQTQANMQFYI